MLQVTKLRNQQGILEAKFRIRNDDGSIATLKDGTPIDMFESYATKQNLDGTYEYSYHCNSNKGALEGCNNKISAQRIIELAEQGTLGPLQEVE